MNKSITLVFATSTLLLAAYCIFHQLTEHGTHAPDRGLPPAAGWMSSEAAAPDSMEGKVRSQKKHWVQSSGEIAVGAYVQDMLEGRQGQPKGRGAIGKVTSIITGDNGQPAAMVDFGRNFSAGIYLPELSLVSIESK